MDFSTEISQSTQFLIQEIRKMFDAAEARLDWRFTRLLQSNSDAVSPLPPLLVVDEPNRVMASPSPLPPVVYEPYRDAAMAGADARAHYSGYLPCERGGLATAWQPGGLFGRGVYSDEQRFEEPISADKCGVDARREVALVARVLAADTCADGILDGAAPFVATSEQHMAPVASPSPSSFLTTTSAARVAVVETTTSNSPPKCSAKCLNVSSTPNLALGDPEEPENIVASEPVVDKPVTSANTKTFPHEIKELVVNVYGKGLRLEIYSEVGFQTCIKAHSGSLGHEEQDAKTFAAWGVDYLADPVSYSEEYGLLFGIYHSTSTEDRILTTMPTSTSTLLHSSLTYALPGASLPNFALLSSMSLEHASLGAHHVLEELSTRTDDLFSNRIGSTSTLMAYGSELRVVRADKSRRSPAGKIRELNEDIIVPEYYYAGGDELQSLNAWFGPEGNIQRIVELQSLNLNSRPSLSLVVSLETSTSPPILWPSRGPLNMFAMVLCTLEEADQSFIFYSIGSLGASVCAAIEMTMGSRSKDSTKEIQMPWDPGLQKTNEFGDQGNFSIFVWDPGDHNVQPIK
jgi:hypothetical protein